MATAGGPSVVAGSDGGAKKFIADNPFIYAITVDSNILFTGHMTNM